MAGEGSSQHVPAFVGHLLTNPAVRSAAEAAGKVPPAERSAAIAKVINDHLGTSLSPEEGQAVALQAKEQLTSLAASPDVVSAAADQIIGPPNP